MKSNVFETLIGAVVLVSAGCFLFFAYSVSGMKVSTDTYKLRARFQNIGTVTLGSDVKISGITVGKVVKQTLDPQTFQAILTLEIENAIDLPRDSSVTILASGLLGGGYVKIDPGGDDLLLKEGELILYTQDYIGFIDILGKLFSLGK